MPPFPILAVTAYRPRVVPGLKDIVVSKTTRSFLRTVFFLAGVLRVVFRWPALLTFLRPLCQ